MMATCHNASELCTRNLRATAYMCTETGVGNTIRTAIIVCTVTKTFTGLVNLPPSSVHVIDGLELMRVLGVFIRSLYAITYGVGTATTGRRLISGMGNVKMAVGCVRSEKQM